MTDVEIKDRRNILRTTHGSWTRFAFNSLCGTSPSVAACGGDDHILSLTRLNPEFAFMTVATGFGETWRWIISLGQSVSIPTKPFRTNRIDEGEYQRLLNLRRVQRVAQTVIHRVSPTEQQRLIDLLLTYLRFGSNSGRRGNRRFFRRGA